MAVDAQQSGAGGSGSAGRRLFVGANVLIATLLVIGIVAALQYFAYKWPAKVDMTSSSVNSLSSGTENLVRSLEGNIRLTSLYFETDRETEDQPRYRRAAFDLLELYESTNRSNVKAEWINPLKDREKFQALATRLREKKAFGKELEETQARIDAYRDEQNGLDVKMRGLVDGELAKIRELGAGMGGGSVQEIVAPVEVLLSRWVDELQAARSEVEALTMVNDAQFSRSGQSLKTLYRNFSKFLDDIAAYGERILSQANDVSPALREYFEGAGLRFTLVNDLVKAESTKLEEIGTPKIDDLMLQIVPTSNAILVETDDDAMVVDFNSVWPPLDQSGAGPNADFWNRAFKGEEKITSAILRATHKEQTAVVFVRYGGPPLFMGGFMPGQPPAPYRQLKAQLEEVNFVVEEWDLKSSDDPPVIDPAPTKTIYIVLKPTPPQRGPMGQSSQEPPFTGSHRQKLLSAIEQSGRALFVAGWAPGPFGPVPSTYEYSDYLNKDWGIHVDTSALLVQFGSISPGKYHLTRRDFYNMDRLDVQAHDIVNGPRMPMSLPWCAPLEFVDAAPEGVERFPLVIQPKKEGTWGIHNIQAYEEQLSTQKYLTKEEQDSTGPFILAAAATKGDKKIVVISSRSFAEDSVAFARQMVLASQGIQLQSLNPGNVTLVLNSLHWLNDNTQFLNVGQPIDVSVLEIEHPSTVPMVQALTIVVWPALALLSGGTVWWFRRR